MNTKTELRPFTPVKRYLSLDFDGSFSYTRLASMEELFNSNMPLVNFAQSNSPVTLMIGSLRQSLVVEANNICLKNGNGSAFEAFEYFAKKVGADFDLITTSDINRDYKPGHTAKLFFEHALLYRTTSNLDPTAFLGRMDIFKLTEIEALKALYARGSFDTFYDVDKILLILLQMHHAAASHPEGNIEFSFVDDEPNIIEAIAKFFKPEWIPKNLTLKLYQYNLITIQNAYDEANPQVTDEQQTADASSNETADAATLMEDVSATAEADIIWNHPDLTNFPCTTIQGSGPTDQNPYQTFKSLQATIAEKIKAASTKSVDDMSKIDKKYHASEYLSPDDMNMALNPSSKSASQIPLVQHSIFQQGIIAAAAAADNQPPLSGAGGNELQVP